MSPGAHLVVASIGEDYVGGKASGPHIRLYSYDLEHGGEKLPHVLLATGPLG